MTKKIFIPLFRDEKFGAEFVAVSQLPRRMASSQSSASFDFVGDLSLFDQANLPALEADLASVSDGVGGDVGEGMEMSFDFENDPSLAEEVHQELHLSQDQVICSLDVDALELPDFGQSSANWLSFLKDFKSAAIYEGRLQDFLWHHVTSRSSDLVASVVNYFDCAHDASFAPNTLRSWFSVLMKFWRYSGRGDLKNVCPLVLDNLRKWDKQHTVHRASIFLKEDLRESFIIPCASLLAFTVFLISDYSLHSSLSARSRHTSLSPVQDCCCG